MKLIFSRTSRVEGREPQGRTFAAISGSRLSTFDSRPSLRAFTLIEVMIAGGILFACLFAILAVLANCLSNARALNPGFREQGVINHGG